VNIPAPRTSPAPDATCLCHDLASCPDEATVTVRAGELASLTGLLTEVDEFLRCGNGAAGCLTSFYARRGDPHPGYSACTLTDLVSFTAAGLRRQAGGPSASEGGRQ
jgi:hypothetical protein